MTHIIKTPAVSCPICCNIIPVSEEQFPLVCPNCGTKITIDKKKSDRIDELMKKVQEEQMKLHPEIYEKPQKGD